jgi:hypothetical protein
MLVVFFSKLGLHFLRWLRLKKISVDWDLAKPIQNKGNCFAKLLIKEFYNYKKVKNGYYKS